MASIIVALGGWRFTSYLFNRDTEKRKAEARAKDAELETMRKQMDWMQEKYETVSKKLDDLYVKFRHLEEEKLELIKKNHELEIALKVAEYNKCEMPDDECIRRIPSRQKCRLKMLLNGTYDAIDKDRIDNKDTKESGIFEVHTVPNKGKHIGQ